MNPLARYFVPVFLPARFGLNDGLSGPELGCLEIPFPMWYLYLLFPACSFGPIPEQAALTSFLCRYLLYST